MMSVLPASSLAAAEPASGPTATRAAEAAIMRAAAGGDAHAFEQLVHLHQRRVCHYLQQMTRQREDAEDLTQQTFIKAFNHVHRVDCERPIINWLLTIARRTALNHFRAAKRWEEIPPTLAGNEPSPAHAAETQEQVHNLWARARRCLSQREFEVLWLRFAEELSTEETARVMELTQIHVKVLVHRARQHLLKGENRP